MTPAAAHPPGGARAAALRALWPLLLLALALTPVGALAGDQTATQALGALAPTLAQARALKGAAPLSAAELARVDRGEIVVRELPAVGGGMPRLTIAAVVQAPVQALYLVLADLDDYDSWNAQLTHNLVVRTYEQGAARDALQYVAAPYPAQDRGWVSATRVNRALYTQSAGLAWEIWWTLTPPSVLAGVIDDVRAGALRLPEGLSADDLATSTQPVSSDGGWLLVPLGPTSTYLEYCAAVDPAANLVERGVLSLFGARMQRQMFESVQPATTPYTSGRRTLAPGVPDIGAGAPAALMTESAARSRAP